MRHAIGGWVRAFAAVVAVAAAAAADEPDALRARIRSAVEAGERDAAALGAGQAWASVPALRSRAEAARQQLRESKRWLDEQAPVNPAALQAQAGEAEMAARELQRLTRSGAGPGSDPAGEALRTELRWMIADGAGYVSRWRDAVATSRRRVRRAVREHQNAAPYIEVLDNAVARARQCLDRPAEEMRVCRSELGRAYDRALVAGNWSGTAAQLERTLAKPPNDETLRSALVVYLQGRYEEVVSQYESSLSVPRWPFQDRRIAAQRLLVAGAARYALFQLGGGAEATHRERALANVRAALSADADVTPSESVFSPRFLLFFESNR